MTVAVTPGTDQGIWEMGRCRGRLRARGRAHPGQAGRLGRWCRNPRVAAEGPARIWDLSPDTRPVEEIAAHARLLATRRLDDRGVLVVLTSAEEHAILQSSRPAPKPAGTDGR